ncbi:DUF1214 domain-containing protein [Rhodoligotrophos defluvii]|uniref:DUF1214 domain-containing protein n=1 Tax=Rhodoligotrophos defluvii TaxID=2561934 RepID=UPI0010C9A82A|nr:DUF1214 domain-containing protein [Rhodoligotrophos defluvii]
MSRTRYTVRILLNFVAFVVLGLAVGYFTVDVAVTRGFSPIVERAGPWAMWPHMASADADPYTRAHFAAFGKLGLMPFEALELRAEQDSEGAPLDQSCTYVLTGAPLGGRWWSIAAYEEDRRLIANAADRHSFNSENIVREPDGSFRITASETPYPGNWLPLGRGGPFRLILTITDAPAAYRNDPASVPVPTIERRSC